MMLNLLNVYNGMKNIVLIDWSWFLFRSWYAISPILDKEWRNINVVFGFCRMMMKLFLEKPDYFVIAWDSPIKTKRHEEYQEYKATRRKMEDEFKQQIPLVKDLVSELWIPNLTFPWYEADDIIYTVVENFKDDKSLNFQVYTSDKDLKQFLCDNIVIKDSMKNQTTTLLDFRKEFWFEPELIIDYLALIWDHADNIKWVTWIWPKKALSLVQNYWTVENIYEHLDEFTPDLRDKLENDRESAFFSKHLIQLMNVDDMNGYQLDNFAFSIDFDKREDILLKKWGFKSMAKLFQELKKIYTQPQQLWLF